MKKHLIAAIAIVLVGFASYSSSLNHGFMLDDHAFFNEMMENIKFLPLQFLPDHNKFLGIEGLHNDVYYRPMALVIPMICHLSFGNVMWAYHLFNLLLFCIAAFLIYFFVAQVFANETLGILTALFYLVHPIHGVVVNFITASVFSAQVIFMLATLIMATKYSPRVNANSIPYVIANLVPYVIASAAKQSLSILFFIFALMCHETAMALPLYLLVLVWVKEGSLRRSWQVAMPYFILDGIYFCWRLYAASLNDTIFRNINHHWFTGVEYIAGFSKLIFWYLGNLVYPDRIVLSWATPISPVHEAFWILALIGLIGFFIFSGWHYRRDKPVLLGLSWLAIGFGPVTFAAVFQPMNGFMIEPHWLIFASIGFFMALAAIVLHLAKRFSSRLMWIYALVLLLVWGQLSQAYNKLWGNEKQYCQYWLAEAPGLRPVRYFLGFAYMLDGQYTPARRYISECISHMYVDYLFYANLGYMDLKEGKLKDAQYHYEQSLRIEPRLQSALCNLGLIAIEGHDFQKAQYYFQRAMEANRFALAPKINMAHLLVLEKKFSQAAGIYEEILDLAPNSRDELLLAEAGLTFAKAGMYQPAIKVFQKVVVLDPDSKQARWILNRLQGNY